MPILPVQYYDATGFREGGYVWVFKVVGMVLCMLYPSESVTHLDSPTSLSADVISIHIDKVLRLLLFNMFTSVLVQSLELRSNTSSDQTADNGID